MYLIEVRFKGNRKEFLHWASDEPLAVGAPVIVDADRGEDLGVVHSVGDLAMKRFVGVSHGQVAGPVTRDVLRPATAEEYESEHQLRHQDDEAARRQTMERVKAHGLTMKITDAEWQWDRKKLTLYFTADRRVDFRTLVRDLAGAFRARIELKQIGVRDEAKRLDGIGRCGRQYCSASWLPELRPVNLGVAKDQGLSLNPLQISGACGRLMCCLRYEHEFYVQSRKRFPKEGRILVTARGEEKVVSNDIFHDRVTLRNVEGDVRIAELADLRVDIASWAKERAGSDDGAAVATESLNVADEEAGGDDSVEALEVGDDSPPQRDRAPRPRRALPMRDSAARPRSSRPPSRIPPAAPEADASGTPPENDRLQADQSGVSDHSAAISRSIGDALPSGVPVTEEGRPAGEPGKVREAGSESGRDTLSRADSTTNQIAEGEDDDQTAGSVDDTSSDETRRRRRRGRRGGRRGRTSREDGNEISADRTSDSGVSTPTGSDDQGE